MTSVHGPDAKNVSQAETSDVEILKNAYLQDRYLVTASDENIERRLKSLAQNLWTTDQEGNVIPIQQERKTELMKRYQHTLIEKYLRTNKDLTLPSTEEIIEVSSHNYSCPKLDSEINFDIQSCFVRFSEKQFIMNSYQYGQFRIQPASRYIEDDLNAAQYDNELINSIVIPKKRIKSNFVGMDGTPESVKENEAFNYREVNNFYTLCFGTVFDRRMYQDFDKDSALIIFDKQEFLRRLMTTVILERPELDGEAANVRYFDPYIPPHISEIKPALCKDFSYLYQAEFRPVWSSPSHANMEYFDIEIGSLEDIAKVVNIVN